MPVGDTEKKRQVRQSSEQMGDSQEKNRDFILGQARLPPGACSSSSTIIIAPLGCGERILVGKMAGGKEKLTTVPLLDVCSSADLKCPCAYVIRTVPRN